MFISDIHMCVSRHHFIINKSGLEYEAQEELIPQEERMRFIFPGCFLVNYSGKRKIQSLAGMRHFRVKSHHTDTMEI